MTSSDNGKQEIMKTKKPAMVPNNRNLSIRVFLISSIGLSNAFPEKSDRLNTTTPKIIDQR